MQKISLMGFEVQVQDDEKVFRSIVQNTNRKNIQKLADEMDARDDLDVDQEILRRIIRQTHNI